MRTPTHVSSARRLRTEPEREELLASARAWNEPRGLTGMLLHSDGTQSVKGADDVIVEVLTRIEADPRHRGLLLLLTTRWSNAPSPAGRWASSGSPRPTSASRGTDFLREPAGAAGVGDAESAQMVLLNGFRSVVR